MLDFDNIDHEFFMREALKEARKAGERGDRPIGAVIVHNARIVSRGSNQFVTGDNAVAHAETVAINKCASYLKKHSRECIIYTTVEPCMMCLSTIVMADMHHVVFAVEDKYLEMAKFIDAVPYIKKRVHTYLGSMLEDESIEVLKAYSPFMAEVVVTGRVPNKPYNN